MQEAEGPSITLKMQNKQKSGSLFGLRDGVKWLPSSVGDLGTGF